MRFWTTAYHPQANGMVERLHRQLKAGLSATNNTRWTESLPLVLLRIRNALKADAGCTSAEPVYGTTLRLPGEFVSPSSFPPAIDHASYSFLGLGQSVDIKVNLQDEEHRRKEELRSEDGHIHSLPVYYDGENVSGSVHVGLKRGGKLEHQGIKVEFIGQIELYTDRGNREEFVALCQDLARPGILSHSTSYPFEFLRVEKPYESYCGTNVRLRYHLQDVIVGKIYFLLVRVKIKNMEIQILKRETIGPTAFTETETVGKYEIMDGAPEIILYRKSDRRLQAYVQQITEKGYDESKGVDKELKANCDGEIHQENEVANETPDGDTTNHRQSDDNNTIKSKLLPSHDSPGGGKQGDNVQVCSIDGEDSDSNDSFSPHTRSARSMHRYESKQVHKYAEPSTISILASDSPTLPPSDISTTTQNST
ncbi:unnamed protein product [Trichobilharzia regenti]|nr:unnamed protein product [Trichobilharzia regenti]